MVADGRIRKEDLRDAVEYSASYSFEDNVLDFNNFLESYCSSFLGSGQANAALDLRSTKPIQIFHDSFRDFLQQSSCPADFQINLESAHCDAALSCLRFLVSPVAGYSAFRSYATSNWLYHLCQSKPSIEIVSALHAYL